MRNIILADNQDITREGLRALLAVTAAAGAIFTVQDRSELQDKLKVCPDAVVVLDYTLFDFSSPQQMMIVKESSPGSSWLLFSAELSAGFLRQVLVCDPSLSVVMKHDSKEEITLAIFDTLHGEKYVCDLAAQLLKGGVPAPRVADVLTAMEKEVLHQIALGKTTKEIAWDRNLSFHTVNSHRKNIFRKLEVNNVHEAIKYALRAGIVGQAEYYI